MTSRLAFLGDTLLGGEAQPILDSRGHRYALEEIAGLFDGVDLVVANLEGPLTHEVKPSAKADTGRKRYWYRADPTSAAVLAGAGVGLVSLANNHTLDFGMPGLRDTMSALDAAGVAYCGAGLNEDQARRPAILSIAGCRIGFISCMQRYDMYVEERLYASARHGGCYQLRPRTIAEDLAALKGLVDLRVVLVHWGRNYRGVAPRQERLAAVLRAAGADLIIGHHPHIAQRVDLSEGKPVVYSLGNGALGTPGRFHSGRPPYGLVTIVELDASRRIAQLDLRLIAVDNSLVNYRPVLAYDKPAQAVLRSLVTSGNEWQVNDGGLRAVLPAVVDGNAANAEPRVVAT